VIHERLPWPLVLQVLGVIAVAALVVATWPVWLLTFTALIIAAAILPAARLGERYRVPRGVTVLIVYVVVAGIMALMGRLLWPALAEQWKQFMDQLPGLIDNVKGWVGDLQVFVRQWGGGRVVSHHGVQVAGQGIGQALAVAGRLGTARARCHRQHGEDGKEEMAHDRPLYRRIWHVERINDTHQPQIVRSQPRLLDPAPCTPRHSVRKFAG